MTVDNGVSGFDAIEEANKLGCDVVITDHHELPKNCLMHMQLCMQI